MRLIRTNRLRSTAPPAGVTVVTLSEYGGFSPRDPRPGSQLCFRSQELRAKPCEFLPCWLTDRVSTDTVTPDMPTRGRLLHVNEEIQPR